MNPIEWSDEGRKEFLAAYLKAQTEMGAVRKAANNPAFNSKYADLATVLDAVLPAFNQNDLMVIQAPSFDGERLTIETIIAHTGGGYMRSLFSLRPSKSDPQGLGSCETYGRRYALLALAGVAPEDDDGNAASGEAKPGQRFGKPAPASRLTAAEAAHLEKLAEEVSADKAKFLAVLGVASFAEIPADQYDYAEKLLAKKRAATPAKEAA